MRSIRQRTADAVAPLQATPGRTQHVAEQVPARSGVRAWLAVDPIGELRCAKAVRRLKRQLRVQYVRIDDAQEHYRIDVAQRPKNCRALTERNACQNSKKRADQHPKRQARRYRPATRRRRCRLRGCLHATSHPQCPAFFITRGALGRVWGSRARRDPSRRRRIRLSRAGYSLGERLLRPQSSRECEPHHTAAAPPVTCCVAQALAERPCAAARTDGRWSVTGWEEP